MHWSSAFSSFVLTHAIYLADTITCFSSGAGTAIGGFTSLTWCNCTIVEFGDSLSSRICLNHSSLTFSQVC